MSKNSLRESVMVALAFASIFLLIFEIITNLSPIQYPALWIIDLIISGLFFIDFLIHYHFSPHQKTFFGRHWWELLAIIPIFSSTLIVLRIFRFLRLVIRIKILLEASFEYTHHSYLIYVATSVVIVILTGAAGFYYFEFGINPNLHSYWDAIWWAIVTTTTIGYGDIFPMTTGGRIVAIFVMLVGIAALSTLVAAIDSYLIARRFGKKPRHHT